MAGLRRRKQRATMRAIQAAALDLFDAHGYDAVSVEEVAERAEVSPSTVYRYYGTKPNLLALDEHDPGLADALPALVADVDLGAGWDVLVLRYVALLQERGASPEDPIMLRRMRYLVTEPDVRLAQFDLMDRQAGLVADALATTGRLTSTQAHCVGHALLFGMWAAVEQWYADGARGSLVDYIREGMGPMTLRGLAP